MTKLTLVCANISINPNQHQTTFVLPATGEAQKTAQAKGQLAVRTIVNVTFSDKGHVQDFESGKQYEITFTEVPAKKK